MQSEDLVSSFGEITRVKDIARDELQLIVEDVIRAMIRKRYGADDSFEIIFNPSQGDIQILHIQEVVGDWDVEDPVTEIGLSKAQKMDEDYEAGDDVASELDVSDFGRRAVMTARQTFRQAIRDIEKEQIFEEYSKLVGEIVVSEIYQTRRHETLVMHEGVELVLPRSEQIPREHYRKGNMLRAIVKEVRRDAGSDPQVVISRTDPVFMERLFELEVPEIYDGIVEIKKIARIPGDRAKVAVVSHDERVDPVGACVGVKGVRIHAVVRELDNENIDVMQYSDDDRTLIRRALSPASPTQVELNLEVEPPRARVEVASDEVSQAIGRGGVNIRLASQLTEYEIDVYREIPADEEDIDIEEFDDELAPETIAKLKMIGCDTAKAVLELSASALSRRAELDRETARHILTIIEAEFERGPGIVESLEQGAFVIESVRPTDAELGDLPDAAPSDAAPPPDDALPEEALPEDMLPEEPRPPDDTPAPAEAETAEAETADVEEVDADEDEAEAMPSMNPASTPPVTDAVTDAAPADDAVSDDAEASGALGEEARADA